MEKSIESELKSLNINEAAATFEASGSLKDLNDKKLEELKKIRHCAFCLNTIYAKNVKLCGQCKRRAYCSKKCQVNDWTPAAGQGHEYWCKLECGEEDIDWKVLTTRRKGLGLIAKRFIPARYRIMVDTPRKLDHPKVKDLMPLGGTLEEKIRLNRLWISSCTEEWSRSSVLCLRIARANHNCDPNACHYYDQKYQVKILFAERDIQPGEEICISYTWFKNIGVSNCANSQLSPEASRASLKSVWGIVCPDDCFCRNQEKCKLLAEARDIFMEISNLGSSNNIPKKVGALRLVNELLQKQALLRSGFLSVRNSLIIGFQLANMLRKLEEQNDFIQKAYEIECCVTSPNSISATIFLSFCNSTGYIDPDYVDLLISQSLL